jgi:hypothetical protein
MGLTGMTFWVGFGGRNRNAMIEKRGLDADVDEKVK